MNRNNVTRLFLRHGRFCSLHSWEIVVASVGIMVGLFSISGVQQKSPAGWMMMTKITQTPIILEQTDNQNCIPSMATVCSHIPQSEFKTPESETEDVLSMTIIRIIALLYGYHQLRTLKRMGTRRVLGLTTIFAVFSGFAFSSAIHLLHEEISELREALFYFLLILDLPKACLFAKIALHSTKTAENVPRSYNYDLHIAEGVVLLGPLLTLDTFLELFVLSIGTISGVRRLQILCSFATLSVVINYIVFMSVYPASLYILLELFKTRIQRRDNDPSTGSSSQKSIAAIRENIYQVHNTMLQRAKIGIAVALVLFHSFGRWPYFTDTNSAAGASNGDSFATTSSNILVPQGRSEMHVRSTQSNGSKDSEAYNYLLKWISVSLDQLVVFLLTAILAVRYFFFEDKLDTDSRGSIETAPPSLTTSTVSDSNNISEKENEVLHAENILANIHPVSSVSSAKMPLVVLQNYPCSTSNENFSTEKDFSMETTDIKNEKLPPTISFHIGESDSDSDEIDRTGDDRETHKSSKDIIHRMNLLNSKQNLNQSSKARTIEECLTIYKSEDGSSHLSDEEVIALVNAKYILAYQLEKAVNDAERGVAIRRKLLGQTNEMISQGICDDLPYRNYDYSKVMGACCENVIGYIPVPVGVAGPLKLDGKVYQVPMATTEGCLVASTNRGCRALQNGVRSRVVHDGMSRAPIVRFPNAIRASEAMLWLTDEANFSTIKTSFDSSSRFARLQNVHCRIAGRHLFIRFVAKTGDAMGMNMISKGTEVALNTMQAVFTDMEILSLSGNVCTDKKPAAINWIEGRGKSVVAEAVVPSHIVENVLKTTVSALVELNIAKNLVGSAMAGSIGGFNAHAANIVTAIYIATGQDPAQNVGSSNCMTLMEPWGVDGKDLFITCTMPSMEIGTVGGGTILGPQSACLQMLGVKGANSLNPGENARTLARIVCGTVLAGELSLMSALAAGHLVRSHLKHNRSAVNVESNSVEISKQIHSEPLPCKRSIVHMQRLAAVPRRPSLQPQSIPMDFLSLPECKQA